MLDIHALVRQAFLNESSITGLVGDFISWPDLPKGFDPTQGDKAVTFFFRGPANNPDLPALNDSSLQVKAWALTQVDAMAVYEAVFDLLDQAQQIVVGASGVIISAYEEIPGQPFFDPDTGWATVVGFFRLSMRAN